MHHQIVAAASPAVYAVSPACLSAQSRVSVEPSTGREQAIGIETPGNARLYEHFTWNIWDMRNHSDIIISLGSKRAAKPNKGQLFPFIIASIRASCRITTRS